MVEQNGRLSLGMTNGVGGGKFWIKPCSTLLKKLTLHCRGYIYIYIYIYIYSHCTLSLSLYIYIYIFSLYSLSLSLYIYIYIYIYLSCNRVVVRKDHVWNPRVRWGYWLVPPIVTNGWAANWTCSPTTAWVLFASWIKLSFFFFL